MSQCVPSWDLEDNSFPLHLPSYGVAELTWQNGQPGLAHKPRAGTLESVVNQAALQFPSKPAADVAGFNELAPWFDHRSVGIGDGAATVTMDALVPVRDHAVPDEIGACAGGGESTRVGSCSGATVPGGVLDESVSVSESTGTCRRVREGDRTTSLDSWEGGSGGEGYTYTSVWSQDNDSSSKDHDSFCHATPQEGKFDEEKNRRKKVGKSSASTKRNRTAAIHSQSERRRREKINQRIKILQRMVPNSTKTDKASMLDEVIEYVKQLQAQVQMAKMCMSQMMMLQQYMNMSMMGMGVMDNIGRAIRMPPAIPVTTGMSSIFPLATFMPMALWNGQGGRLSPDFFSAFLSNQQQQQQLGFDAYSKLATLYQQFQQPFAPKK